MYSNKHIYIHRIGAIDLVKVSLNFQFYVRMPLVHPPTYAHTTHIHIVHIYIYSSFVSYVQSMKLNLKSFYISIPAL